MKPCVPIPLEAAGFGRAGLRRRLRARRRDLDARSRRVATRALTRHLLALPLLRGARRIGFYLANDGEMDPGLAATALADRGASLLLPVIDPLRRGSMRLRFAPVCAGTPLRRNRYGIREPLGVRSAPAWSLDVVLLPLVGFDRRGGRLGMGGGFYDRTFDVGRPRPARPRLIGVAHAVQEVDRLELASHDVPLDAIVTDRGVAWLADHRGWGIAAARTTSSGPED
ncbi:MAG TPA: 5-formyltetrahydrofolate cyclo-ligase [Pseudomonadales bacterium]|nr:5-formyltetrahydrofolate cyclo-ligase [Pseudomonadales bacterium]